MPALWRYPDLTKLLIGQAISEIGSVATRTALPIAAVLVLDAGPLELGVLVACASAGVLGVGPFAGAWVDRLARRPLMIAADIGRALAILTIPLAAVAGALRIELLYGVAFTTAALGVLFDAAYRAYPPALVPRERLVEANSALSGASSVAELAGPSLGGALVQFLTAPFALLVDAISFVVSAASLALIRAREPAEKARETEPIGREIAAGLSYLARERSLRTIAGSTFVRMLFGSFFASLYTLYALEELGLSPLVLGVVISGGGIGGLAAAALAAPLARRFGVGPTIVWAPLAASVVGILTPLAGGPWAALFLFIPQVIGDGAQVAGQINAVTLRQNIAPPRMLGRVNATMNVLTDGIAPVGAFAGALLAEALGIRAAVWIAWAGGAVGALLLLLLPSPLLRTRELPESA